MSLRSSCDHAVVTTDGQSASPSWCWAPVWAHDHLLIFFVRQLLVLDVGRPLWREDGSVICSAVTLWSESRRTHNRILLSHLKLPKRRKPGLHIYIPQAQGGPVISLGTEFPSRRLLPLARLRWRYSNPPPHGVNVTNIHIYMFVCACVRKDWGRDSSGPCTATSKIYCEV
jgi:hypothetical protein